MPSRLPSFVRDPSTWALYLVLGYYSFVLNTFGAFMPFLRLELDLSYTQVSQHSSLFAIGLLLSSLVSDRLAHRFGAKLLIWGGASGMALGLILSMTARSLAWSLSSFFLIGLFGALALIQISSVLAAKHGPNRTRAISEANVMASFLAVLAPLSIAAAEALRLGWRVGVGVAPAFLLLLLVVYSRAELPLQKGTEPFRRGTLPGRYWRHWTTLVLGVAAEFGVMFWAVDFLSSGPFSPAAASLALSGFLGTMLLGRMLGTRLANRLEPIPMVLGSLLLALVSLALYWLGSPLWQVTGILLAGLGVANIYPYNIALALGTVSGNVSTASARISLGAGGAILLSPIILGAVADLTSLKTAQGLLLLILLLAVFNVLALLRSSPDAETRPEESVEMPI